MLMTTFMINISAIIGHVEIKLFLCEITRHGQDLEVMGKSRMLNFFLSFVFTVLRVKHTQTSHEGDINIFKLITAKQHKQTIQLGI